MKHLLIFLFVFLYSTCGISQNRNLVGIFRNIDQHAFTYVEFKADSTVIVKTLLRDSFKTKRAFIDSGTWSIGNDSVFLKLTRTVDDRPSFTKCNQLVYLIKNENALYTNRYKTGKFVTDGIFKKARKLIRLQERFLAEYSSLN